MGRDLSLDTSRDRWQVSGGLLDHNCGLKKLKSYASCANCPNSKSFVNLSSGSK